ncbi:MAG: hypothetical protein OQL09_09905 [Gammaproteobacteria bacterium]|nr:hypothetical protein [Gammaproteobacteria bacterium]
MNKPVVLIGMGEMAGVFARGFLRSGYPVFPLLRGMDLQQQVKQIAEPELVLVAVAENDLHPLLEQIPDVWRDKLLLLQNELLPADWQKHRINQPTVISVWFEKKKGQDAKVIIPSPVYGPKAQLVHDALASIGIASRVLDNEAELLFELVVKNLYILTTNISGLETGGNVGELWAQHRDVAEAVAKDVITIQQALTGETFDVQSLMDAMLVAFEGDHQHMCMGRSASGRLQRALALANEKNIEVPKLQAIASSL